MEDYQVVVGSVSDWGDAPDGAAPLETPVYPTLNVNGGASDRSSPASFSARLSIPNWMADAAIARWNATGLLSAEQSTLLEQVRFEIADLPGNQLGVAEGARIVVDLDGGGQGWFLDLTPMDDVEFTNPEVAAAVDVALVAEHVDLLTALAHELGHILGLADLDASRHGSDLMAEVLGKGRRKMPEDAAIDLLFGKQDF